MQPWKLVADPSVYIFKWLIAYSALLGASAACSSPITSSSAHTPGLVRPVPRDGPYWYRGGFHVPALVALARRRAPLSARVPRHRGGVKVPAAWTGLTTTRGSSASAELRRLRGVAAVRAPRVESGGSGRKAKRQYRRALDTRRGARAPRYPPVLAGAMMGACRFRDPRDADLRGARASTDRRLTHSRSAASAAAQATVAQQLTRMRPTGATSSLSCPDRFGVGPSKAPSRPRLRPRHELL
jgi:hypothetical protein